MGTGKRFYTRFGTTLRGRQPAEACSVDDGFTHLRARARKWAVCGARPPLRRFVDGHRAAYLANGCFPGVGLTCFACRWFLLWELVDRAARKAARAAAARASTPRSSAAASATTTSSPASPAAAAPAHRHSSSAAAVAAPSLAEYFAGAREQLQLPEALR